MIFDNSNSSSRPLPPTSDVPLHDTGLKPWVIAGITAIVLLGIVAWNVQGRINSTPGNPAVTTAPNTTTGIAPASR